MKVFKPDGTIDVKEFRKLAKACLLDPDKSHTKHYQIDNMVQTVIRDKIHFAILLGGRQLGKSTELTIYILRKMYELCCEFIYIRRHKEEITVDNVQGWAAHLNISVITDGEWDAFTVYQGKIYFSKHDPETQKIINKKQIGWTTALAIAGNKKSVQTPKVTDTVFEEMIPEDKPWLANEPQKLESYISTVFRSREGTCWMVGNTISRICPYIMDWKLDKANKMKPGQLDRYDREIKYLDSDGEHTHVVRYAVEECKGVGLFGRMAAGEGSKQITSNSYRTFTQPCVSADFIENDCTCLHTMYLFFQNLAFKMEFTRLNEREYFWYVKPAKNGLKQEDLPDERCITDTTDFNPLHTGITPISIKEKKLFNYLALNKIFYCDDMTGTDFKQCYKSLLARR